jgi:uncharacterized lipoprotein YddW (UPF0748 family)
VLALAVAWGFLTAPAWAQAPLAVLVQGDASQRAGPAAAQLACLAFEHARRSLQAAQVPFCTTADTRLARLGFGLQRVAVFPYNPVLADREAERLSAWVASGGRPIFVHALPPAAAKLLGLPTPSVLAAPTPGALAAIVFPSASLQGLPSRVLVAARWVGRLDCLEGVQRLGAFVSAAGRLQLEPAVYFNARAAYVSCLLVNAPPAEAGALLRALAGHFAPALWEAIVPPTPAALKLQGPATDLEALLSDLQRRQAEGPHMARALRTAREAAAALAQARALLQAGLAEAAVQLAAGARGAAELAFWRAWPSRSEEVRGVWATSGAPSSWSAAATALAAARFKVVFPYMASGAAAFYPSTFLPPAQGHQPGEDCLAAAARACFARGLKLHPRLLGLSCLFSSPQVRQRLAAAGRLMVNAQGQVEPWLCPTHPANRRLLINVGLEMASKYLVQGVQLDYFRYPNGATCLCQTCRAAFEAQLGRQVRPWPQAVLRGPERQLFLEFRRRQLTSLLAEMRSAVRRVRPGLPLSAAVFVDWPRQRDLFGQDWVRWLDEGLLDFACPMNYTASLAKFEQWAASQRQYSNTEKLCFGIGPFADGVGPLSPLAVAEQIRVARRYGGGWVLFNLRPELLRDYLPRLAEGICSSPAKLPAWAGG